MDNQAILRERGNQPFQSDDWYKDSGTATGRMPVPEGDYRGEMYVRALNAPYSTAYKGSTSQPQYVIPTISNIFTEKNSFSIYAWRITVISQGGQITLYFTDETGDEYKLSILNPTEFPHHVSYNSKQPAIVKVRWER